MTCMADGGRRARWAAKPVWFGIGRFLCSLCAVLLAATFLAGCAAVFSPSAAQRTGEGYASKKAGSGWWYARFQMNWPPDEDPRWHMDALLAHAVLLPVLDRHKADITLWRFHRRAARDLAGHQFSFIFFSSQDTAREVYAEIMSNPVIGELKKNGSILRVSYDEASVVTKPNIEDTSDPAWSPEVKRTWPYFIMGVSQMWLKLVSEASDRAMRESGLGVPEDREQFYRQVNASVESLWKQEGGHACLHHLNALFGYVPVMVRDRLMRF